MWCGESTQMCVNVLVKDDWRQSKKWTLADAEPENLPLPNLSQPSSILSPAHLREVAAQLNHILLLVLEAQLQIFGTSFSWRSPHQY